MLNKPWKSSNRQKLSVWRGRNENTHKNKGQDAYKPSLFRCLHFLIKQTFKTSQIDDKFLNASCPFSCECSLFYPYGKNLPRKDIYFKNRIFICRCCYWRYRSVCVYTEENNCCDGYRQRGSGCPDRKHIFFGFFFFGIKLRYFYMHVTLHDSEDNKIYCRASNHRQIATINYKYTIA